MKQDYFEKKSKKYYHEIKETEKLLVKLLFQNISIASFFQGHKTCIDGGNNCCGWSSYHAFWISNDQGQFVYG